MTGAGGARRLQSAGAKDIRTDIRAHRVNDMRVKVAKWGNSIAVRLPKAAAAALQAVPGTELELTIEGGKAELRQPHRIPHYRLEDMVAEMKRLGPENEPETVEWGPDVGSEIIEDDWSDVVPDDAKGKDAARRR